MRTKLLFIIPFFNAVNLYGQTGFEKLLDCTGSYRMDLVELASGNILTGLTKYPGISLLDPNANLIHSKCFYGDSVLVMGSIQPISLDRFYFTTIYVKDSCSSLGSTTIPFVLPAIGIMDTLGNILELHHYSLNAGCTNPPGDLVVTNDGGRHYLGSAGLLLCIAGGLEPGPGVGQTLQSPRWCPVL